MILEAALGLKVSHINLNMEMDQNSMISILNQISLEMDQDPVQVLPHHLLIHILGHLQISTLQRNYQLVMIASTVLANTWVTKSRIECHL